MVKFKAIGVSEGLAKAKALVIKEEDLSVVKETVADAEAECKRVLDAVEKAKQQIEVLRDDAEKNIGAAEAEIFDAHLMMLDDPDFVEGMTNIVTDEKVCAEYACFVNCENFRLDRRFFWINVRYQLERGFIACGRRSMEARAHHG